METVNTQVSNTKAKLRHSLIISATVCLATAWSPTSFCQSPATAAESEKVLMDILVKKAQKLAREAYQPPPQAIPKALKQLSYDQYRNIRFDPSKALWRNQSLFEIQLFHPGFLFKDAVELQIVDANGINQRLPFDDHYFIFGDDATRQLINQVHEDLAYSGFRVHFPLNTPDYKDEMAVFQGASYFRLVGPGQVYGLSARGLAINTAEPSGEEFPRFTDYWLFQPQPDSNTLVILALLDSPSMTGAYRFELGAAVNTTAQVDMVLFPRTDIKKVGIAPLTSMFFFGEANLQHWDDYRKEVHDSDGLLMNTANGQWIWRPLSNPKQLQVTSLSDQNPRGFGLLQRDRDFEHYLDNEARYHDRPSLWVQPRGEWGAGRVELVEIPTDKETNDNIVAYWVPQQAFRAGQQRRFSYTLSTFNVNPQAISLARVERSLQGWGANPGDKNPPPHSLRQFAVDFTAGPLQQLPATVPVAAAIDTSSGSISHVRVSHIPTGWRVAFQLQPDGDKPADMRLHLHLRGTRLSEEWSYVWNPGNIEQ